MGISVSSRSILVGIKEYILMTFGMFCYAFGWQMCVLPAGGMGGGAAGLATLINAILPVSLSEGLFTIGNLIFIINCILLILGVMIVGWKFGIKTLYCILMMSVMFNLVSILPADTMVKIVEGVDSWRILLVAMGAASCGVGIAVSFMQGGSTGGTDIVAMIINKFRTVSYGKVLLMTDCGILIGSLFLSTSVSMVPTEKWLDDNNWNVDGTKRTTIVANAETETTTEDALEFNDTAAEVETAVVAENTAMPETIIVAENTTETIETTTEVPADPNNAKLHPGKGEGPIWKNITIPPLSADSFARMIYGFLMIAVIGYTVDLVQSGNQQSNQIMIFCKDYESMANMIMTKANRGATLIDAMGSYSKTPSKAVMVVCRKRDTSTILKFVREEDPKAFITVGSVMGVYGQGFDALNKL